MTRHKSTTKGRKRPKKLTDQELLASAWAQLRNKPKLDSSGCMRAVYPGHCPRCERDIAVGQEIHRHADFPGWVHRGCKIKPPVLEQGRPHTVSARKLASHDACLHCHLEHSGECW